MNIELRYFNDLINDILCEKKIILYGNLDETKRIQRIANLYHKPVSYIVDEKESPYTRSYLELIYQDIEDIFILICKNDYLQACINLEEIGLKQQLNYRVVIKAKYVNLFQKFPLDINIGYTYFTEEIDEKYPGVTIFGNTENSNAYKIVTVGGSTSDSQAYLWKCWSQILYEKFLTKKKEIIIYSAGVSGYRSSQELMKLERDLLNFMPDMVISLSGVNDTGETEHPFVQAYSEQIFNIFCNANISDMNGAKTAQSYTSGFKKQGSLAENWIKHIRMMNAICCEFNIRFYAFLQPMIGSKKENLSQREWELVINGEPDILDRTELFLTNVKELLKEQKVNYIHDISDLFDKNESVYIDGCHVTEEGNRMIADRIFETIDFEVDR